jgi:hypothetical protein
MCSHRRNNPTHFSLAKILCPFFRRPLINRIPCSFFFTSAICFLTFSSVKIESITDTFNASSYEIPFGKKVETNPLVGGLPDMPTLGIPSSLAARWIITRESISSTASTTISCPCINSFYIIFIYPFCRKFVERYGWMSVTTSSATFAFAFPMTREVANICRLIFEISNTSRIYTCKMPNPHT